MNVVGLIIETNRTRTLTVKGDVLTVGIASGEFKVSLVDKTIRDLAATLSEFVSVSQAIEPYCTLPATSLDFGENPILCTPGRTTLNVKFQQPPPADEQITIMRVIDPDDPDEDFLQWGEFFL